MNHESIARKIRALLTLAENSGATEDEAIKATAKAKELMDKYQIDLGEAELLKDGFANKRQTHATRLKNRISQSLAGSISRLTDTRNILIPNGPGKFRSIERVGLKTDVMLAEYFDEMLTKFVIRNSEIHKKSPKAIYESYQWGVIFGIRDKIDQVIAERKTVKGLSGKNELVPIDKSALVEKEFNRLYPHTERVSKQCFNTDKEAFEQGEATGRGVHLSEPVSGNKTAPLQIN